MGPQNGLSGPSKGAILDPLFEPFWPEPLQKGVDFILLKLGQPRGLLRPLKKGVPNDTPK